MQHYNKIIKSNIIDPIDRLNIIAPSSIPGTTKDIHAWIVYKDTEDDECKETGWCESKYCTIMVLYDLMGSKYIIQGDTHHIFDQWMQDPITDRIGRKVHRDEVYQCILCTKIHPEDWKEHDYIPLFKNSVNTIYHLHKNTNNNNNCNTLEAYDEYAYFLVATNRSTK